MMFVCSVLFSFFFSKHEYLYLELEIEFNWQNVLNRFTSYVQNLVITIIINKWNFLIERWEYQRLLFDIEQHSDIPFRKWYIYFILLHYNLELLYLHSRLFYKVVKLSGKTPGWKVIPNIEKNNWCSIKKYSQIKKKVITVESKQKYFPRV